MQYAVIRSGARLWLLSTALAGSAAIAQQSAADGEIVVSGRRVSDAAIAIGTDQTRNTISITQQALLSAPAGISGLKMLESLPGFNVQANDALGLYEFGNSVFVRAFNFRQIGFVLDGVPMGRSDQFGGSPIFRYVENENLQRVTASPGAGDVSAPSYASLGPIVQYFTTNPAPELGVQVQQSFGSDSLSRSFVRLDTGHVGPFSAYGSYSRLRGDLWRGPGTIERDHVEAKLRYAIDDGNDLTFRFLYNDYFDYDSPAITVAQYKGVPGSDPVFNRSGREFAYLGTVPSNAILPPTVAGVPFSNPLYNQYYKQAINSRTDYLYSLTGNFTATEHVHFMLTGYYEDKKGYGVSPEAYSTSLASYNAERLVVPGLNAPRGLQYGLSTIAGERYGITGSGTASLGLHTLTAGFWVENDDYHRTQNRFNHMNGNPDGMPLLAEPVHRQRDFRSTRETLQLFTQAKIELVPQRLRLELGWKALDIGYLISGQRNPADYIAQRSPQIRDGWSDWFLPQAGLVWNLTAREQLFTSYAENMALPSGADDIYSLASPAAPGPKAETSKNAEFGFRTNRETYNLAAALFYTKFDNRLQAYASPIPGAGTTETFYQNVGSVEAYGFELSGTLKPHILDDKVYFNANVTYNKAEFKDDFSTFKIKNNRVPDNAEWIVQGGVTAEPASWMVANLSARYLSSRYSNFTNTEKIPGYVVASAYVDIGDGISTGPLKAIKIRVNIDNIFDKDYLGTINTTVNTLGTFRPGPRRTVQGSLRAEF
jgi:iron complex outermembrane receptor protein